MCEAFPEFGEVRRAWYPSNSAFLYRERDGYELRGEGSWRLRFLADNAAAIPRLIDFLVQRLWEMGRGWIEMGERLALEAPVEADVVIPVPDSGTPAAVGYARASGIPFGEGLVKNRYVGRTFIQPDQALRERGVKLKFNALRSVLAGQRVVVVDDSIVRGSTTRKLVTMLFEAGAVEVHLRDLLSADHLPLLLRHRHGRAGAADRLRPKRRGGGRAAGRHLARLPFAGRPAGGDPAIPPSASAAPA